MENPPDSCSSSVTPSAAEGIDRLCDRFEAAWQAGQNPRIEDYVQAATGPELIALLRQLLLLELDYRTRRGHHPQAAEYRTRFPDHVPIVDEAFRGLPGKRTSNTPPSATFGSSIGSTSSGLLNRARARDAQAWQRLVAVYTPFVYRICRRDGLLPADAADVTQDVFASVVRSIGDFRDTGQPGSFRAWLAGIVRHRLLDHLRRERGQPQARGGTDAQAVLLEVPDTTESVAVRDEPEADGTVWRRAVELLRTEFEERTWQAFWQVTIDGQTPAEVAPRLGMTVAAVYQAKSRVLRRLRQEFQDL
jgi:RNA polymerase sigma-70 factor (ECF subfamily)